MLSLALAVVAIALPDSLNPSLIAGELVVAGGRHPGARAVAFTVAAGAVTFAVGLALALGLGDLIVSLLPKPGATITVSGLDSRIAGKSRCSPTRREIS